MAALKEIAIAYKTKIDTSGIDKADKKSDKLASTVKRLGVALAATFGFRAIKDYALGTVALADELDKTSQKVGLSTDALQEWRFAAQRSGVPAEKLGMSLGIIQQRALEASKGSKTMVELFGDLGVTLTDADGGLKSVDRLMSDVATGMSRLSNPTERTGIAMRLFGESGKELLPLLSQGAVGVDKLRAEFRDLGGGLSAETVKSAADTADAMTNLDAALMGVRNELARYILPAVKGVSDVLVGALKWWRRTTENVNVLRLGTIGLGVALAATTGIWMPKLIAALKVINVQTLLLIGKWALMVAGIAAVALVIEDLIVGFQGGQSAIRDFLNEYVGVDIANITEQWSDAFDAFMILVEDAPNVFDRFGMHVKGVFLEIQNVVLSAAQSVLDFARPIEGLLKAVGVNIKVPDLSSKIASTASASRRNQSAIRSSEMASGRALSAAQSAVMGVSSGRSTTVNQTVNVNASGMSEEQATNVVRKALNSERRAAMAAAEGA